MILGYKINGKTFVRVIVGCMVVLGLVGLSLAADQSWSETASEPWWEQEKIRFFWGVWQGSNREPQASQWNGPVSRETMKNLSEVGATVFVELRGLNPANARLAHKYGLRYFACLFSCDLSPRTHQLKQQMKVRWSVNKEGEPYSGPDGPYACPVYKPVYGECFFNPEGFFLSPVLKAAQEGLVDGLHLDWEHYTGRGEAGECYCDDCFGEFMKKNGLDEDVPKAQRYKCLHERDLLTEYTEHFEQRRIEMFRELAARVHAIKPDFVFSGYHLNYYHQFAIARGLNTPEVPFFIIDSRHYFEDHTRPWWESHYTPHRQLGMVHIAGSYDNSFFGGQPESNVSAPQWMYDAAINSDGYWMWFEEELTPAAWRAFWLANRRIRATEQKVGEFLLHGEQGIHFVTAAEWSGNPEFDRNIIQRTYHLGDEHLVHVHNVDTDRPMRIRLRFPRLPQRSRWIVTDPLAELTYAHDADRVVWSARRLKEGIVVSLEKRSELFLKLSPARTGVRPEPATIISSQEINAMPEHARAAATAAKPKQLVRLYVMKNSIYDGELEMLLASTNKVMDLPETGWQFKPDKDDNGVNEKWYLPETPLSDWKPIKIGGFWGSFGGSLGAGWYRREVVFPELPEGKRVYLSFGAVDEELVLWIDGKYVGDYNRGPDGWDKPFAIEITSNIGKGKHHLVMRVFNTYAAGGIWKPVSLIAGSTASQQVRPTPEHPQTEGPAPQGSAPAGPERLVGTVTESLGYLGSQGGWAIGNAIHAIDANGENHQRLYKLKGYLWSPVWSPEGTRIAFCHYANGRGQIYVMNADGSQVFNLSNNDYCDKSPVWSPDGNRIAFVSDRDGDWEIYVMNADGSQQTRLTNSPGLDRAPAWSPDGQCLAFESDREGDSDIYVTNADGSDQRPVVQRPGDQREPTWSPDGTRIACAGVGSWGQELLVVGTDSGRVHQLMVGAYFGSLCWSPDGQRFAGVFRGQERDNCGIFTINADETGKRTLVDTHATRPYSASSRGRGPSPSWYSLGSASPRWVVKTFGGVCWSPDGTRLAFSSDMGEDGCFYIYTIWAEGGQPTKLDDTASAWLQQLTWCPQ